MPFAKIYFKRCRLTKGHFAIDTFLFEDELPDDSKPETIDPLGEKYKHVFGCAKRETGEFYNQMVDGIIGIGSEKFGAYSTNPPNIIETEAHQKRIKQKVFSICFGHDGGAMKFGDWNSSLHVNATDPKRFTTIYTDSLGSYPWSSQYRVPVKEVDLDGQKIDYDYAAMNKGRSYGEGAFFDSGTTFIYVAADFYRKLKTKMENYCTNENGRCGGQNVGLDCYDYFPHDYKEPQDFFNTFPKINFNFGTESEDKIYTLYPQDYLIKPESEDVYCVGIKTLKNMILGGVFWRNYDIKFDKDKKTISYARADCSKTGLVKHNPDENKSEVGSLIPDEGKRPNCQGQVGRLGKRRKGIQRTRQIGRMEA